MNISREQRSGSFPALGSSDIAHAVRLSLMLVTFWVILELSLCGGDVLPEWGWQARSLAIVVAGSLGGFYFAEQVGLRAAPILDSVSLTPSFLARCIRSFAVGVFAAACLYVTERALLLLLKMPALTFGWTARAPLIEALSEIFFEAAFLEEIVSRLFFFSFVLWLLTRVLGKDLGRLAFAFGDICQAVLFSFFHALWAHVSSPIEGPLWLKTLLSFQTWGGLWFGYVYWRFGIETAIIQHATYDLITSVAPM